MINRRTLLGGAIVFVALFSLSARSAWWPFSDNKTEELLKDATELGWDSLIPDDFVQPENPYISMTPDEIDKLLDGSDESNAKIEKLEAEFNYAPVVPELDGIYVKIPTYITPLEFDGQTTASEFLLVPYVGACMHTPPPPANQVVFAESPEVMNIPDMYEPVWAIGTIYAETVQSNLAETGYRMDVKALLPYTE
jgi:hypothetical protein